MTTPTSPHDATPDAQIVDFARSEVFERTYREGMGLVEETAAYLDGPGRAAARTLPRMAALAYAGETMRLTTCLMQVASWLMVQRAVRDGEISVREAQAEKYQLSQRSKAGPESFAAVATLPEPLQTLSYRADALYARVERLDSSMRRDLDGGINTPEPGLAAQVARLRAAFGDAP